MSKHMPPIPEASVSPKGPGGDHSVDLHGDKAAQQGDRNLAEQGRQGNIKQNTTNQGYQQDR